MRFAGRSASEDLEIRSGRNSKGWARVRFSGRARVRAGGGVRRERRGAAVAYGVKAGAIGAPSWGVPGCGQACGSCHGCRYATGSGTGRLRVAVKVVWLCWVDGTGQALCRSTDLGR